MKGTVMTDSLENTLTLLSDLTYSFRDIKREYDQLIQIKDWAFRELSVANGDAVTLKPGVMDGRGPGWAPYEDILAAGSTGVIQGISIYKGSWYGTFTPDVCWSKSSYDGGSIYLTDPKHFIVELSFVRKRTKADKELVPPANAKDMRRTHEH